MATGAVLLQVAALSGWPRPVRLVLDVVNLLLTVDPTTRQVESTAC